MEAVQYFRPFFNLFYHYRIEGQHFKINAQQHKLFIVKCALIMTLCVLAAFCARSFADQIIPNRSCINRMINWLCLGSALAASFMVTWESLASSKEESRIWDNFNGIENMLLVGDGSAEETIFRRFSRMYSVMFYAWLVQIVLVVWLMIMDSGMDIENLRYFILIFEILSTVDSVKMLQIVLYVRILTAYVHLLANKIKHVTACVNQEASTEYIHEQLRLVSKCYFACMKVFCMMQDQFGCSLSFMCFKYSIALWNEIYWTVYRSVLDRSFRWYCLNIVPYHFVFIYFTWACEQFYAEIHSLSRLIYTINIDKVETSVRLRIQQLQLLLDYKVLFFHTFGICLVSYKLIVQYFISGITKVSFIAQILIDFSYD
ncbi:uncharacterized protein LOC131207975 [Anopheles bellator]|uniref:uncharacterized protein LOC131207975 n=1 Tax=Anopheles bellator TaxID=139047 RepID=UPI002648EE9B|nr:uncharacterized protein LOC131207975 [Anopheles bellator]